MSRQIVKQPNGKLAIFSTGVDHVIFYDATKEELLAYYREREEADLALRMSEHEADIDKVLSGERIYFQWSRTWDEWLAHVEGVHGADDEELSHLRGIGA